MAWVLQLFIEQFKRRTHYTINLPAQRLLTDSAAVRSAQSLSCRDTPRWKRSAGMRPPPDFQRKWAEINLQLNFLRWNVRVNLTKVKSLLPPITGHFLDGQFWWKAARTVWWCWLARQSLAERPHVDGHEIHWLGIQKPSGIPWSTPVGTGFAKPLRVELEPIQHR